MQYVVNLNTFKPTHLQMVSTQLLNKIIQYMSDLDFAKGCATLQKMFSGLENKRSDLFEMIVIQGIIRQFFHWKIYVDEEWKNVPVSQIRIRTLC